MKTSLALTIVLALLGAAVVFTFGAPVTPISGTAVAGPQTKCSSYAPKQAPYGVSQLLCR